jgi:hypothetical protein
MKRSTAAQRVTAPVQVCWKEPPAPEPDALPGYKTARCASVLSPESEQAAYKGRCFSYLLDIRLHTRAGPRACDDKNGRSELVADAQKTHKRLWGKSSKVIGWHP